MFDKRTLIAFLLIGLIIIFSPAYYRLITDEKLPSDTLRTNDRVYNSPSEISKNNDLTDDDFHKYIEDIRNGKKELSKDGMLIIR